MFAKYEVGNFITGKMEHKVCILILYAAPFIAEYIDGMYDTLVELIHSPDILQNTISELKSITPSFMNTMLEKQSRDEAVKKRAAREALVVVNVPPTIPGKDTYDEYCQRWNNISLKICTLP